MKFQDMKKIRQINHDVIAPAFFNAGLSKVGDQIEQCADFSKVYQCKDCQTREWKGVTTCHSKYCLICNTMKSRAWLGRLFEKLEQFLYDGKYIVFLTLTIRDRPNLEESLDILNKAWGNLTNHVHRSKKEFFNRFSGGLKSLEVKTGKFSKLWHPHLHCILVKDYYMYDFAYLSNMWRHCIQLAGGDGSEGGVHIETIYMKDALGQKVLMSGDKKIDHNILLKGIVESVKYISKFDYRHEPKERLKELVDGLKGARQVSTFGSLRFLDEKVEADVANDDRDGVVAHTCKVCGCNDAVLITMLTDDVIEANTDHLIIADNWALREPLSAEGIRQAKILNGVIKEVAPPIAENEQLTLFDDLKR